MKISRFVLYSVGAFVAFAAIGSLISPKLAAAVRAAYVEVVVPSQPFVVDDNFSYNRIISLGPDTGTLGITNITLSNNDTVTRLVFLFQPTFSTGGCGSGVISGSSSLRLYYYLQPKSTLVVPFPTPLVFGSYQGHTCLGASVADFDTGTGIEISVSGFVN